MSDETEAEFQRWFISSAAKGVDLGPVQITNKLRQAFEAGFHAGAAATATWPSDRPEHGR